MYLQPFLMLLPVKLPVLCSKCWRPRIPRHHFQWCRWCSSSSSPSTPREETLFNKDVTKWSGRTRLICKSVLKIVLSHMTTSSASFFSWISPPYANLFSPAPAGTCKRRNIGKRDRERKPCRQWKMSWQPGRVLAWPILGWPCLQFLLHLPLQRSWQSAENSLLAFSNLTSYLPVSRIIINHGKNSK